MPPCARCMAMHLPSAQGRRASQFWSPERPEAPLRASEPEGPAALDATAVRVAPRLIDTGMPLLTPDKLDRLCAARSEVNSQVYDELLYEVAARVESNGSIGKADVGALLFWKRLQANTPWAGRLQLMPEVRVRAVTAVAVEAVRDTSVVTSEAARRGRAALSPLPGFAKGDALASALLLAAAPGRMAVYDRRAQAALDILELPLTSASGRYGRYMALVEELRGEASARSGTPWIARDVDLALYWLGG